MTELFLSCFLKYDFLTGLFNKLNDKVSLYRCKFIVMSIEKMSQSSRPLKLDLKSIWRLKMDVKDER